MDYPMGDGTTAGDGVRGQIDLPRLAGLDRERIGGYRELLEFYRGRQWVDAPARRSERRLTLNYAKTLIEKTTSYLLTERSFAVDPLDDSAEEKDRARRTEEALAMIAEENDLDALDFETEIDTAILGDGAYKVIWDSVAGRVRITAPDVQGLYAWPVVDDSGRIWRIASRYEVPLENSGALSSFSTVPVTVGGGRRGKVEVVEVWTDSAFGLYVDGKPVRRMTNPYGLIPFVVFPNIRQPKQFWGVSDIPAIAEPQRELNRAFSQISRILELSGNPIAVLENVDSSEDIAVGPGAVWEMPERSKAYLIDLLSGGGVGLHIDYINAVYRALHDLAEAPRTAFGDNSRSLAGVALEIELQPLIQKVMRKRLVRTPAYRRRAEMALRLLDQFTGSDFLPAKIRVVWGALTPRDVSRQLADEQQAVAAGLRSRRTAMSRLGTLDPDRELARWIEEEDLLRRPEAS